MEKTLTIEKNEAIQTKTGKTYHRITAGGIGYSCWEFEVAQALVVGTIWVVDVEQKGQFWNITGIVTQLENARVVPLPIENGGNVRNPEWGYNRRAALEKATLLAVAQIGIAKEMSSIEVMKVADAYFRWLSPDEVGII